MSETLLHFGCGALGLGLVVKEFYHLDGDVDIYVANRRSSDEESKNRNEILESRKHYFVREVGVDIPIKVKDFIFFDEEQRLIDVVTQDQIIYFTTSLKETGVEASLETIASLLLCREKATTDFQLLFIACENAISSTAIKQKIEFILTKRQGKPFTFSNKIMFVDCVVDRLCNQPLVDPKDNVIVLAENYWSWILDGNAIKKISRKSGQVEVKKTLQSLPGVEISDDLTTFVNRKKWIVNALHQAIALWAHDLNFRLISRYLETENGIRVLEGLASEIYQVFLSNEGNINSKDAFKYINKVKERLMDFPSNVRTALTRFEGPASLAPFFKDYNRKIGEPVLAYMSKTNKPLYYLPYILLRTTYMISQDRYVLK
jgi:mannitol-1-phosphate/altronate dehydrogenase